jgi:lipoprotein-anchoring transpeptidase ErfK/SrfK
VAGLALAAAFASLSSATAPTRHGAPGAQRLLVLHRSVIVRAAPSATARPIGRIATQTPLTRSETVLPVLRATVNLSGSSWLRVSVPARPNGTTGWVRADAGRITGTPWMIVIHRGQRRAVILRADRIEARFPIIVGKPSTPTPLGRFFVTEKLQIAPGVPEGPWALATSAYSDVLQEFAGGPGQIALHGTVGLDAPLGTFSSHGCIRFANAAITWLAHHINAGTPIIVER